MTISTLWTEFGLLSYKENPPTCDLGQVEWWQFGGVTDDGTFPNLGAYQEQIYVRNVLSHDLAIVRDRAELWAPLLVPGRTVP